MTDRELDRKVAELLGYSVVVFEGKRDSMSQLRSPSGKRAADVIAGTEQECWAKDCPHFSTSADACEEVKAAVRQLDDCEAWSYMAFLTDSPHALWGFNDVVKAHFATPKEICIAFIRVKRGEIHEENNPFA